MKMLVLGIAAAAVALVAASCSPKFPRLVWNASPSIPMGFYWIESGTPRRGEIAAIRLPPALADLAARRQYLPLDAVLLKPVVAAEGAIVCRVGSRIVVNGKQLATSLSHDAVGRRLPSWQGCHRLQRGEFFVVAPGKQSFDGRYFGRITAQYILGRALSLSVNGLLSRK